MNNPLRHLRNILHSVVQKQGLNKEELLKLVSRLEEAGVSTQRFVKLGENKAAFEKGFQKKPYSPEQFDELCGCYICNGTQPHQSWGVLGKETLVLVDFDNAELYNILSKTLPETFEVTSPRRKLQHKYFIVIGGEIQNAVMYLQNDVDEKGKTKGAGEIRAQNNYLVAAGTQTEFGTYKITKDAPIAKIGYSDFLEAVKPYLKSQRSRLNQEDIIKGVGEGKRHETGMQYAGHLIGYKRFDYATALHEMRQWNENNNPPLSDSDLERMVKNAVAYNEEEKEIPTLNELFPTVELPNGKSYTPPFKAGVVATWMATHRHFKYNIETDTLYYGDKLTHRWTRNGEKKARLIIAKILGKDDNQLVCKNIIYALENLVAVNEIKFSNKIACENGLLDPELRKLYPFNLDEMTLFSIPTKFDPDAKCPNFQAWLDEVQPEKENQMLLQEWSGYLLLTDYRFHKALFCWGEGRNGKTVWASTMTEVIGGENESQVPLEDLSGENRFALLPLYGKLFNVSSEPSTKQVMETPNFKRITGGDRISAEQKGKDVRIDFVNLAKVTVLGNHFPRVDDHSVGFKERIIFQKWTVCFTGNKAIPNIQDRWKNEYSGILNWMLEGLHRLLQQNHFTISESSIEISKEYTRQSDNILSFIEDMTLQRKDATISKNDLYTAYLDYCANLGLSEATNTTFTRRMRELKVQDDFRRIGGLPQRIWVGIALKNFEDKPVKPQEETKINRDWAVDKPVL